jgi:hemerythrin-like domain-containing protein
MTAVMGVGAIPRNHGSVMELLDNLRRDHRLIEMVLGSLCGYASRRATGAADARDAEAYLQFFRVFAGDHHHLAEEHVLFPALVEHVGVSADRGPIAVLAAQHVSLGAQRDRLEPLLRAGAAAAPVAALEFSRGLWAHIDAEDSVLFPEAEARLRRSSVYELPSLPLSAAATEARALGERLLIRHTPRGDGGALRGEGCVVCPAYGAGCDGLEREWWNDSEWDEIADRVG